MPTIGGKGSSSGGDAPLTAVQIQARPGSFKMKEMGILFSTITDNTLKKTHKTLWRRG